MAIDLTSQSNMQQAIENHLLNPDNTCLAFREGRWKVINNKDAQFKTGFFQKFFRPSPPIEMAEICSVKLFFEQGSYKHTDHSFSAIVEQIGSLLTHRFGPPSDEGYDLCSCSYELLGQLNMLKQLILANPTQDYTSHIERFRSELSKIPSSDPTHGICKSLLKSIGRIIESRNSPQRFIAQPAAPSAEEIARKKEEEALKSFSIVANRSFDAIRNYGNQITEIMNPDNDRGSELHILDESGDLSNYENAKANYSEKKDKIVRLVTFLTDEISCYEDAIATILARHQGLENHPQIQDYISHIRANTRRLRECIGRLNTTASTETDATSELLKIQGRYKKRQQILNQATEALNAYAGKTPILLSFSNEQLHVEEKPLITFRKGIATTTLPDGKKIAYRQEFEEQVQALIKLAMPVSPNIISDEFLLESRAAFLAALEGKIAK